MFSYVVDAPRYQKILDAEPRNLNFELDQEKNKGVVRHYAIPGKQRCIECHMGSQSRDFVLGFTPIQVRRRPRGVAGTYEDQGADELNQLQRLIDYGVITGVASPSDIRGLEEPQGSRKPRNDYELRAQAYLLANCAFCHTPRGFPSVKAPELADLLDLYPSDKGGIFQFPLDRMSPLRRRGKNQDVEIPYITPSLRDYPVSRGPVNGLWQPKWTDCSVGGRHPVYGGYCDLTFQAGKIKFIAAPWRSLIFRNVDTPYIYAEDFTVFPHMPRHSAGFDCRAPRIMAEWMVSIPAVHKKEFADFENNVLTPSPTLDESEKLYAGPFDTHAQPYEEVKPGDPDYARGLEGAAQRLWEYRAGPRYSYCADNRDIVVREALTTTDPNRLAPQDLIQMVEGPDKRVLMPDDRVPDRAHWIPSDITETPGDWAPRRGDWESVLVNPKPPNANDTNVPWVLKDVRISQQMRDYALREIPFALWRAKPACDFTGVKRVKDFAGADRPRWMDVGDSSTPAPSAEAPVYMTSPGRAIFENICVNCHGARADSKGLLAEAISEMTGGDARVANFRDGILGPGGDVGGNIRRVFGPAARATSGAAAATADDLAARYLAWMALGGTQRLLPPSLLAIVGATPVMGYTRANAIPASANMLELARGTCGGVLAPPPANGPYEYAPDAFGKGLVPWTKGTILIDRIGDAEMWMRVCTVGNRPVVRVLRTMNNGWYVDPLASLYWGESYGSNPIMNHLGKVEMGIRPDNLLPLCVAPRDLANASTPPPPIGDAAVPVCPGALFEEDRDPVTNNTKERHLLRVLQLAGNKRHLGREEWETRGAANAGAAVLLYLQDLRRGSVAPKPAFDRCEQLRR
jgi:mono/diheme cytochrome c family protein